MKEKFEIFNRYVNSFDLSNEMINNKFKHTYRVFEYAKKIAISEHLDEHDTYIATLCALLHDIGRFKQVKEYNTYYDNLSFDHGDIGYKILKENNYINEYVTNEEDINIILKSVKNHNKYEIEDGLTEREIYFSKLTRDADKLDIMACQCNEIKDNSCDINLKLIENFNNHTQVRNDLIKNDIDRIIRNICFIHDFNFKESFNIVLDKGILDIKFKSLKENVKNYDIKILENKTKEYIKERID